MDCSKARSCFSGLLFAGKRRRQSAIGELNTTIAKPLPDTTLALEFACASAQISRRAECRDQRVTPRGTKEFAPVALHFLKKAHGRSKIELALQPPFTAQKR